MSKRKHFGSTGNTPGKTVPKKPTNKPHESKEERRPARRSLFSTSCSSASGTGRPEEWSREETSALVEYVALYWEGSHTNGWPTFHDKSFWEACAKAIVEATGLPKRTGTIIFGYITISYNNTMYLCLYICTNQ